MNKIKEAIADLRAYLGRDAEGLRRLDAITNVANDMRKEIATTKEAVRKSSEAIALALTAESEAKSSAVEAKTVTENAERQRKSVERELSETKKEIERLQSELARIQLKDLPDLPDSLSSKQSDSPFLRDVRKFTAMFNHVRREMRVAPTPVQREKAIGTGGAVYELTDIATSYDADEMIRLGRFVTSLALMNMPVRIVAQENFRTSKRARVLDAKNEDWMRDFVYWMRSNMRDGNYAKSCTRTVPEDAGSPLIAPAGFTSLWK